MSRGALEKAIVAGLMLAAVASYALVAVWGVSWNTTPSVPRGLYRAVEPSLGVSGGLVVACLPESPQERLGRLRGYIRWGSCPTGGRPVLKRVAAVSGDIVGVSEAGVTINGALWPKTRPAAADSAGRPLWPATGGVVPPGHVWLLGERMSSFDSRYWGAVPVSAVRTGVTAVLVVGDGS